MGFDFDTGVAAPRPKIFGGIGDDIFWLSLAKDDAGEGADDSQVDAALAARLIWKFNKYKRVALLRSFFWARSRLIRELADRSPASHDRVIEEYWERLSAFQ